MKLVIKQTGKNKFEMYLDSSRAMLDDKGLPLKDIQKVLVDFSIKAKIKDRKSLKTVSSQQFELNDLLTSRGIDVDFD